MVMRPNAVEIALVASALITWPGPATAQFPPPPPPPPAAAPPAAAPPAPIDQRWPAAPQTSPQPQQPPQAQPTRTPRQPRAKTPPAAAPPAAQAKPPLRPAVSPKTAPKPARAATTYAVTCNGVFAKDTNHLKLAVKYDSRNIAYTDVEGPGHTRLKATVLFPRDPKHRLEVLWNDEATRSNIQVISINGQSSWTAPKGLKLGLSLSALQKLNGRPFKLSAFGPERNASVLDWQGGALAALPGGCKVGVQLVAANSSAPAKELLSSDAALTTVTANVAEILVGY